MASADKALLQYEAGQTFFAMSALTDSGDATIFSGSASLWSRRSGYEASVLPNGLKTGGAITATGTNDEISVAALTCNLNGVDTSVPTGTTTITRPATAVSKVCSITINAAGSIAVVAGTDGSDANFVETRGAAGGPPFIPTDSIEIGQVRMTSNTAAAIAASEIKSVVGSHVERYDYPVYSIDYATGEVTFASALPAIHTGSVSKAVYAEYAEPVFAEAVDSYDYVPPEISYSTSSTQVYNRTTNSTSSSLGQGSFSKLTDDGITDPIAKLAGETLWFKFYPDRNKAPHRFDQGKLGIARTYPAGGDMVISCTVSAESVGKELES